MQYVTSETIRWEVGGTVREEGTSDDRVGKETKKREQKCKSVRQRKIEEDRKDREGWRG